MKMTIEFNGKRITANKPTLNYISLVLDYAAQQKEHEGRFALAGEYHEFANFIYDVLKDEGFYS